MEVREPEVKHFFHIWHISKGELNYRLHSFWYLHHKIVRVKKKLTAISKSASCRSIQGWIQATSNHLYWCAKAGGGNAQLTIDIWKRMQNHVVNVHAGHAGSYKRRLHDPIPDGDWLDPGKHVPTNFFFLSVA